MKENVIYILIFNKIDNSSSMEAVIRLTKTSFRVARNSIKTRELTIGTEFEVQINKFGKYEITRITKQSDFLTRRFYVPDQEFDIDYDGLVDQITRQGGYWQTEDIDIMSISMPNQSANNLEEIFRTFNFYPEEF